MVVKVVKMKMITRVMSLILIIHLIVAELQKVSGPRIWIRGEGGIKMGKYFFGKLRKIERKK